MNKISIVIPVLNELDSISKLIHHLEEVVSGKNEIEIIFADGGSLDGTITLIEKHEVKHISSNKGRAIQMNAGAKVATGNVLYFLHIDSFPPKDFDQHIFSSIENNKLAGCFQLKFDSSHVLLSFFAWFTRFNSLVCRGGDQSLFITKELFNEINGFDENYSIYEDNEIVKRLYDCKQFTVIPKNIITSARKYKKNGVWRLQYHFAMIHLKRRLGHSVESLKAYYQKHIR